MLWLVTPVHGRPARTRLCLEQRARMLTELAGAGVRAGQVIVGDDENLDTARELGFVALERRNVLGFRVNEGFEWACREGGASHVAYCGSDDWHLASFFADVPDDRVRTSALQGFVPPSGDRLVVLRATAPVGGAPWVVPRALLAPCRFRPAKSTAMNGVDSSIADGIMTAYERVDEPGARYHRAMRRRQTLVALFDFDDRDALRMVDFKGDEQVTPWRRLAPRDDSRVVLDTRRPWETLAACYPADLVERMQKLYAEGTPR